VLTKTKVIDGRDHMLGRLASIVGKELLAGQTIVIVRCDEMVVSGSCECNAVECWRISPSEEDCMQ
jgi:ribosomal protein L13